MLERVWQLCEKRGYNLQSLLAHWKEQLLKDSTIHKIFVIILLMDQAEREPRDDRQVKENFRVSPKDDYVPTFR